MKRAIGLDWAQQAAGDSLAALAADKGKGAAAANGNGSAAGSGKVAARAAAAAHPLAPPPAVLERLRRELRLSKLQAGLVWRVLLLVVGRGEAAAAAGVESLIRQAIIAQVAEAKGDAQGEGRPLVASRGLQVCLQKGCSGSSMQGGFCWVFGAACSDRASSFRARICIHGAEQAVGHAASSWHPAGGRRSPISWGACSRLFLPLLSVGPGQARACVRRTRGL